jgi:hypothetical protein
VYVATIFAAKMKFTNVKFVSAKATTLALDAFHFSYLISHRRGPFVLGPLIIEVEQSDRAIALGLRLNA